MSPLAMVLALLGAAVVMFALNRPRMDVVAVIMMVALPMTGVITMSEALVGLSDPNIVLIAALFVIGEARADPRDHDLPALRVTVTKNGAPLSEGLGAAVQGSPLQAVAWLANTLGAYGVTLNAGDIILSGSLVPLEPAAAGDVFEMELHGIGRCVARFV